MTIRIAMWSGPRNLSTAMMYSFAARGDCRVVDEPFYAAYLDQTGAYHPMRNAVLRSQDRDPERVAETLVSPVLEPVFYQKHMTHHMLPDWNDAWMAAVQHVFLIRHPARVVASYARKREAPVLDDLGFVQQTRIFDQVGGGVVVDSSDIRADPSDMLPKLCNKIGVPWTKNMLSWPAGGHSGDGIWAAHWYNAVHASTGFDGAEGTLPVLEGAYADLADAAMPHYEALAAHKIT
ncbi:HAD family hydrolase [uncultured Tateyamaria sp.]|uniref:sulfotransferase-like domain-containing protein n=1 Tax=uncultured Tateyamaria sp. TaxID=455651 RepID=UPI0026075907|nr:HAD family hydrolase [uncultured Tateyamaria sp.]